MTDRPDDLIREARAEARQVRYWLAQSSSHAVANMADALASVLDRLADALEAAQKTSDGLYLAVKMSAKEQEHLRTRVRQLEEALNTILTVPAGSFKVNGLIETSTPFIHKIAREVLAAKENTTP